MRAHIVTNGVITNTIVVASLDALPGLIDGTTGSIGDQVVNGVPVARVPPPPALSDYTNAVQSMLDTEAKTHGYDGILSAATYANSTNPKFQAEGQACVEWRDAVWGKCYLTMAEVSGGQRPQPTVAELVAMMPAMVWPE